MGGSGRTANLPVECADALRDGTQVSSGRGRRGLSDLQETPSLKSALRVSGGIRPDFEVRRTGNGLRGLATPTMVESIWRRLLDGRIAVSHDGERDKRGMEQFLATNAIDRTSKNRSFSVCGVRVRRAQESSGRWARASRQPLRTAMPSLLRNCHTSRELL